MDLTALAQGVVPLKFTYKHSSAFDAGSPYSLLLALLPETCDLRSPVFAAAEVAQEDELAPAVAAFVEQACARKGWTAPLPTGETATSYFYKVWLRTADAAFGRVSVPALEEGVDLAFVDGALRPLLLYRRLNTGALPPLSLHDVERGDFADVLERLLAVPNAHWTLRQRFDLLILPFARFRSCMDALAAWLAEQPLAFVAQVPFETEPALHAAVVEACMQTSTSSARLVQSVLDRLPSHVGTGGSDDDSRRRLERLLDAANTQKFSSSTFGELNAWAEAGPDVQNAVLLRLLETSASFGLHELHTLRTSVFSQLTEEHIMRRATDVAVRRAKLRFLTAAYKEHGGLVRDVVQAVCAEYEQNASLELAQVLAALDVIGDYGKRQQALARAQRVHQAYGVDARYALTNARVEVLSKILELHPRAYLKFSELVATAAETDEQSLVASLCVDAALADDNFTAVQELVAKLDKTEAAWIAFYQAGNFVSPTWDLPRPAHIRQKQIGYLATSLALCPSEDLVTVLRSWTDLVHEDRSEKQASVTSLPQPEVPQAQPEPQPKRGQISNLLVSGLGWAIGANQIN